MDSYDSNLSFGSFDFQSDDFVNSWPYEFSDNTTPVTSSTDPSTPASPAAIEQYGSTEFGSNHACKRRLPSSSPESGALARPRKTRRLKSPKETAQVRVKGACYGCKLNRKTCQDGDDPEGSCRSCLSLSLSNKMKVIPGLLRPLCWRPNIGSTEMFRRGPTIDFAASHRGNLADATTGKQASWKTFATRPSSKQSSKVVELSQGWTSRALAIQLDRYAPKPTDKQYYSWYDGDMEYHFDTPAYGISNLDATSSAIQSFLTQNAEEYITKHLIGACETTRQTFAIAQEYKQYFPLVTRALKLWVGCRFIEEPWSIIGTETLDISLDDNPNCPYHDRIPVPPIVDLQIDVITINDLLQPEMKKILKTVKEMLESRNPWKNWFEIYLAYFILLHNVELTMAHDAWFVKRNNLKTKYSNKNLVDTIMQGATTLLTCFHYAHQGYAPFSDPKMEESQSWNSRQKGYLADMRSLLATTHGDYTKDPSRELFWTSQLHRPNWRPLVLSS
ncbi:hypothetical protein GLAREA_12141 [Glarea lozoyensis ATCC 20868]|uniref:Zn(2)-C6 fungal-type domain-containing protein n=1 Tax=Glarea lozoyensis (strain ATCC 20868 / MF5171) TaxID=1116229 RepID=S3D4M3_GLAL2|nr:uncharacterized protein GLAREA_12141 [Glarea lozoyensis ATCC 20868]EPE32059.1 hypothetical protein GLAREA_12141 [Glarea lozoyensis ATCC 20868]